MYCIRNYWILYYYYINFLLLVYCMMINSKNCYVGVGAWAFWSHNDNDNGNHKHGSPADPKKNKQNLRRKKCLGKIQ